MGEGEGRDGVGNARLANSESIIANLLSLFNEGKDFCLQGFLDFN